MTARPAERAGCLVMACALIVVVAGIIGDAMPGNSVPASQGPAR